MTLLVHRPDGAVGRPAVTLAALPPTLAGCRIGVLDNGKPNAAFVLTALADHLAMRTGARRSLVTKKGPSARSANAAIPAAPDVLERLVAEADVVLTGTADCGSCTAYSVHDALALEQAGRPTVVVTTTEFAVVTETLAGHLGVPDLRRVMLPHPIGGTDEGVLDEWASAAVDAALAALTLGDGRSTDG